MRKKVAILTALIVIAVVLLVVFMQPWTKKTTIGLTFNPMRKHDTQTSRSQPGIADIDSDLTLLDNKVNSVRSYSVLGGMDLFPQLAEKHHLDVMIGVWIGRDLANNRRELDILHEMIRRDHDNIVRIAVGNEVLLRGDTTEERLIAYIQEVRQWPNRPPVSTSETWVNWMKHPKLAQAVDYIAVHLLPYWDGVSVNEGVNLVFDEYDQLQKKYPDKLIVVTEVGWPSAGDPLKKAIPSPENQAAFLREFMRRAHQRKINYYIIEAFDQPWKLSLEGSVGPHWGVFDADRKVKYPIHL